ncbi:MAG: hypothetical protein Q8M03_04075 [Legionella sp.]|nr:hypothetical protein [Legionella sp.]
MNVNQYLELWWARRYRFFAHPTATLFFGGHVAIASLRTLRLPLIFGGRVACASLPTLRTHPGTIPEKISGVGWAKELATCPPGLSIFIHYTGLSVSMK